MVSPDTFLIALYVLVDDFCKQNPPSEAERTIWSCGRVQSLTRSEVVSLSVFGQWSRFRSERDYWRYCEQRLLEFFPNLPDRAEFVRMQQRYAPTTAAFALGLASDLEAEAAEYEVIDRFGVATRRCGRRGGEWLPGYANKGKCSRLGFFHGLQLMCATTSSGVITGYGFASGSTKDQPMATSLFAARRFRDPRLPTAGRGSRARIYLVDKGFSGPRRKRFWKERFDVSVLGPPQKGHGKPWPAQWERWLTSLRQIVETVHDRLLNYFRLERERPHTIQGFQARFSAKVALHNFCIWLNRALGRQSLQFADLLGW